MLIAYVFGSLFVLASNIGNGDLKGLPSEIWDKIFLKANAVDLLAVQLVCKFCHQAVRSHEELLKRLDTAEFKLTSLINTENAVFSIDFFDMFKNDFDFLMDPSNTLQLARLFSIVKDPETASNIIRKLEKARQNQCEKYGESHDEEKNRTLLYHNWDICDQLLALLPIPDDDSIIEDDLKSMDGFEQFLEEEKRLPADLEEASFILPYLRFSGSLHLSQIIFNQYFYRLWSLSDFNGLPIEEHELEFKETLQKFHTFLPFIPRLFKQTITENMVQTLSILHATNDDEGEACKEAIGKYIRLMKHAMPQKACDLRPVKPDNWLFDYYFTFQDCVAMSMKLGYAFDEIILILEKLLGNCGYDAEYNIRAFLQFVAAIRAGNLSIINSDMDRFLAQVALEGLLSSSSEAISKS